MPYQPGLEDDEEMGPETFADPYAAPLPPAPTPQPADVQNVGMASLAGMDPNNIDLKKVLYAQLMESSKYGDEANKLKARDTELGQQEAQQMLNNQLQDRAMQFAQALSPGAKQMKDNTTELFASKIGADQKARSALRQQLLAKAQGGQQAALKGMVDLQGRESADQLRKDQFVKSEAGRDRRTQMMADAQRGVADQKLALEDKAKNAPLPERLSKLKEEDKKRIDSNAMGLKALEDMKAAMAAGEGRYSVIGDNTFTKNLRMFEEAIGRMQSGGAISEPEGNRFKSMARTFGDDPEIASQKLDDLYAEMSARMKTYNLSDQDVSSLVAMRRPSGGVPAAAGFENTAVAAPSGPSPQDKSALQWVNDPANAQNPKLPAIKEKLKAKGLL